MIACTACANFTPQPQEVDAPRAFYTVTGELALLRHEPRMAALEYAAAAESERDANLLQRASNVTLDCLQPSLTGVVAARWIEVDPESVEAHRAAGRAALALHQISRSAAAYRVVIELSSLGSEPEIKALGRELAESDNVYGARQLADRLVQYFPASAEALRARGFAAMRADDPNAAVTSFRAALAVAPATAPADAAAIAPATAMADPRRELSGALQRARILAGDKDEPLAEARATLTGDPSSANRLDYAVMLLAAQDNAAARAQLIQLTQDPDAAPAALRLLGLLDFQDGKLDDAAARFAELVTTGKYLDDALYYLALIAERHGDVQRAVRLYAQVQGGENVVPALMRAAAILRAHGAAPEAEQLLDRLEEDESSRAPEILASRARIYVQAGDLPRASAVLDQGVQQYPDSVELRYATASLFEERGQVSQALHELKTLVKLRPDDPAALNAYGYTLADQDRHLRRARKLIERAYAAAPNSAAISDSFGWVLYRQGHGEQALPYLHQAYAGDRSADMAAHLGEVLWQLGRQTDARRVWTEAALVDADNPLLKATRARLHASN